jgi:hypothetical protein
MSLLEGPWKMVTLPEPSSCSTILEILRRTVLFSSLLFPPKRLEASSDVTYLLTNLSDKGDDGLASRYFSHHSPSSRAVTLIFNVDL